MNSITTETAKQTISGLTLMTMFTLVWAGIAFYGFNGLPYEWLLSIFVIPCIGFVYYIFLIRRIAPTLPVSDAPVNEAEVKKKEKWFMIICAGEGIGIFLAVNIVVNLHHPELQVPAIALAVGLHFFPLAKIFERKMDYYIGAWSTLIAVLAIMFTLKHVLNKMPMIVFTGVGLALATTCYGINMILKARRVIS
ncbi:MAG TPA: hypothetical protein ENO28_09045 [Bacteroidetes bacterium]|nr:hypothetical protein [Bacteroidota bacterium]